MVVLASDGRDSRRGQRARFPVLDLDLDDLGVLDAPYPTNLPWPSLAAVDDGWLMVTFDCNQWKKRLWAYLWKQGRKLLPLLTYWVAWFNAVSHYRCLESMLC